MQQFKKYDKYKDSGFIWADSIPFDWRMAKFGDFADIAEGQVSPLVEPYLSMVLIAPNHIEKETGKIIELETSFDQGAVSGKYFCKKSSVIYSKIRPSLKKACIVNIDTLCSADMYPIKVKCHNSFNSYFLYLLISDGYSDYMINRSNRVAMPKVNREDFSECLFILPPLPTQIKIAEFLDTRAATIDAEIELLTTKAAKYKQLKQSLINQVVTKGLNPEVEMKDTGIDWIGSIPKNWEVRRLKEVLTLISSGIPYFEGKKDYLSTKSIGQNQIVKIDEEITFTDRPSRANMQPLINSSWFAKMANTNKNYLFTGKAEVKKCILSTGFCGILPNKEHPQFINYYLMSDYFIFQKEMYSYGTTQISINESNIELIHFVRPPKAEQVQITEYLDTKTGEIDRIITAINDKISKLKQYRKVLINDVVTGRINVEN